MPAVADLTLHERTGADIAAADLYAVLRLRSEVFVVEQECAYLDPDGRDLDAGTIHLWLATPDGAVAAYVRVLAEPTGGRRIGRVVTDPAHRGQQLAGRLIDHALTTARAAGGARRPVAPRARVRPPRLRARRRRVRGGRHPPHPDAPARTPPVGFGSWEHLTGSTSSPSNRVRRGSRWPRATSTWRTGSSSTTIGTATSSARRCCSTNATREVFAALDTPAVGAASLEVLELVLAATGADAVPGDLHPLDAAGRLVQEDLCLMVLRDGAPAPRRRVAVLPLLLAAGRQARPADGRRARARRPLRRRAGRQGRHVPAAPAPRAARVAAQLEHPRRPELLPPRPHPAARRSTPPDGLYLRSERQTLRRLETADVVLFTIRTQQVPLAVLDERPDVAHRMAAAIAAGRRRWSPTRATTAAWPPSPGSPAADAGANGRSLWACSDETRAT